MIGEPDCGESKACCSTTAHPSLSRRTILTVTESSSIQRTSPQKLQRCGFLLLAMVTLVLFVARLAAPSNLMDNDQERPASYVMDAALHGHWWCQSDWTGDIMSKPPLFTWIAAVATLPVGHANLWSLYFPCLVAMLLTVGLLFRFGRDNFGWAAGFLAGLMYLATPSGVKHIALARTDALFAATIALTALTGYRAWTTGRGWPWFWFAAALATLTKGPLGVLLGAMGLLAIVWEKWDMRRSRRGGGSATSSEPGLGTRRSTSLQSNLLGVVLFFAITVGWFWLAYQQSGQAFIDKVIGKELLGHMVSDEHGTYGIGFVKAPLYWLSRFLPWSLLGILGLWRVLKHPATEANERRFERFLFCWVIGGLLVFSLATHQRGDLPLPLYPATALLAGRELARLLNKLELTQLVRRSLVSAGIALALYTVYLHTAFARTEVVQQSEGMEVLAAELNGSLGETKVLHVDSPYALQFHMNTMDRLVSITEATDALNSDAPMAVAVHDVKALRESAGRDTPLHTVGAWPGGKQEPFVAVYSNQPK